LAITVRAPQFQPLEPAMSSSANGTRTTRLGAWLFLITAAMFALSFAAVPFYRIFCQATGYNGTTQRAAAASTQVLGRAITVRFDSNTSSALDWDFQPEQREMRLKIGENALALFRATNRSSYPLTGTATFNVTPEIAGAYFDKVQCFCFTEQTLAPGQSVELPVSFFIDPAILDSPEARNVDEITLSYTFFKVKTGKPAT
jgi:cytochrome c oxidase assembly protein subunit 11